MIPKMARKWPENGTHKTRHVSLTVEPPVCRHRLLGLERGVYDRRLNYRQLASQPAVFTPTPALTPSR